MEGLLKKRREWFAGNIKSSFVADVPKVEESKEPLQN